MRFITVGQAIRLGEQELGPDRLNNFNLLDSAVARPRNYVAYVEGPPDIHTAAAHLLFGIACNHAFIDGNKRVGLRATGVFYALNGWELCGDDGDVLHLVLDVADGGLTVETIAKGLSQLARPMQLPDQ
jgi:death-on-curing protein